MKDWVGNKKSVFITLGASNHTTEERQSEDYYATEPKAAELLLQNKFFRKKYGNVLVARNICRRFLSNMDMRYEVRICVIGAVMKSMIFCRMIMCFGRVI